MPTRSDVVVVAVHLGCIASIESLRSIEPKLRRARRRIFLIDDGSRLSYAQAYALGATKIVNSVADLVADIRPADNGETTEPLDSAESVAEAGAAAIRTLFSSVAQKQPIDLSVAMVAGSAIAGSISRRGLRDWLDVVRRHHEGTYQHCLLVTGVTVDFAVHLGLNQVDVQRLCSAAMLHDIGKAAIPHSILDKPGRLDAHERTVVETHPAIGYDALRRNVDVSAELLDVVRHHHEFLDGSGYPDGLCGGNISDLVRIVTITDIFSALIERRSYRDPMPRAQAFEILSGMHGKLERPLLAAFEEVALHR